MVSTLSIIFIVISGLGGIVLPIVLFIYLRKVRCAEISPFFVGAAVMLVFAFILEGIINALVLNSSVGGFITTDLWVLALYGGLMAGVFEETGRFVAFHTVLCSKMGKDQNALMYGAGHGGFEAVAVLTLSMISNLVFVYVINSGGLQQLLSTLTPENKLAVLTATAGLVDSPSYFFLLGLIERIFALVAQLSCSVLVWFAVKNPRKFYLFPLAIFLHALLDGVVVYVSRSFESPLYAEVVVIVFSLLCAAYAYLVWAQERRQNPSFQQWSQIPR